jgi:predicted ATPase
LARTPAWQARNFLTRAVLQRDKVPSFDEYPFNIPTIGNFIELDFEQPVTFFIGENGSGKSTLLEAIAVASGLTPRAAAATSTSRPAPRIPG